MNNVTITGEVVSDIREELNEGLTCCKFKIKNLYYNNKKSIQEPTYIDCICYGYVAEYCLHEVYTGCKVLITGRILSRTYIVNCSRFNKMYIGCNTVTQLVQEDYS